MDFSAPYRVITTALEGPVLRVLGGVQTAMTRRQILAVMREGSEAGVRKALARLVEQGIVIENCIYGSRYTYEANRDHLLWPYVLGLLRVHDLLREKVQDVVLGWEIPPVSVELFGSVAHGGATAASDVDLLILQPGLDPDEEETWAQQTCDLQDQVFRWTGNLCDILVLEPAQFAALVASDEPLLRSGLSNLAGLPLADVRRDLCAPSAPPQAWRAAAESAASSQRQLRHSGGMEPVQSVLDQVVRDIRAAQRELPALHDNPGRACSSISWQPTDPGGPAMT